MKKSSTHLGKLKLEVKKEFGITRLKAGDKWNLHHLALKFEERGDNNRVAEMVDLFMVADGNAATGIKEFYWWYSDNKISEEDGNVYSVFDTITEELKLPQANPNAFAGLGDELMNRIDVWKGKAGNSRDDILIDYFAAILPEAAKFNSSIITSPKSLLQKFGWGLFEQHIEEQYGGKQHYLTASKKALKESGTEHKLLNAIQRIRDRALENKDITEYDRIGGMLSTKGINHTHATIKKEKR